MKDFDSRFFYYDKYSIITESLLHSTSRSVEEEKFLQWAIFEEDLEPGLALDPTSYAAKAMQRKRKEPPTEAEVLSSVRKRPTTPPQEGTSAGSPVSAETTLQGRVLQETVIAADGTPTTITVKSAAAAPHSQESTPRSGSSRRPDFGPIRGDFQRRFSTQKVPTSA